MTAGVAATPVSTSMVLAIVDEAWEKGYASGVIGMRGAPDRAVSADVQHHARTVRIRPAESALAVREVLREHHDGEWMVVVTDRDDADLGAGVLAHFVWQRLRSPDPWEAVRHRFAATGIDPALTLGQSKDLAVALLAATPPTGWPAAPAGILTRSHALASVARAHLDLEGDTADVLAVLRWSMRPPAVTSVAELRESFGDRLADETLNWIADRSGASAAPVRAMLRQGEMADIVPLGIVLSVLTSERIASPESAHAAQLALVRLEPRWNGLVPPVQALRALGGAATALMADLVHDQRWQAHVERVLQRADAIVTQVQAEPLSVHSDLLPSGFRARLTVLADALRRGASSTDPASSAGDDIESAWGRVTAHRLGTVGGPLLRPFHAAVRLTRWLRGTPQVTSSDLGSLARAYMDDAAWADAAINDAFIGVDDPHLTAGLAAVLNAARARRSADERSFASALAHSTAQSGSADVDGQASDAGTIWYLERLLPKVVLPMATKAPVFLLVMDGMSAATATEILTDATERLGWVEAALPRTPAQRRAAALAVLPSLTEMSRASMLSGRLAQGQQAVEVKNYIELTSKAGKLKAVLFHKKSVDSTAAGASVGADVGAALDDPETKLVTVVLNTIDDALDRSDPAGTTWNAEAVKHLESLLARARGAGRTVVITADHGHVVERREGTQRSYAEITSGRSRAVTGVVEKGEVEVAGPRVLTPDHRAVLAVDEGLRYAPLKAGYHGGASAAEVVVPVAVLLPDEDSNPLGLELLPPQVPAWWLTEESAVVAAPVLMASPVPDLPLVAKGKDLGPTLFDEVTPAAAPAESVTLGAAVVASSVYKAQRRMTGRLIVKDDQVIALVDTLAAANGGRLPLALAARALGLNETRLRGALAQVQQLLNVEGYAVIGSEPQTGTVLLDERLLSDQFEVR